MATPTVPELAARPNTRIAYVLFLEGIPWAFTDEIALVGDGTGGGGFTWIENANGDRNVLLGLKVPDSVTFATSLQTGMLSSDDTATFGLVDFTAYGAKLIAHLREVDAAKVAQRLGPLDDPAPDTLLDTANPANDLPVWLKYVNHEAIGQFGERRRFQVFPGDPLPGYDHAALRGDNSGTLAASQVYDEPPFFRGRICALWRIYKDVTNPAEDQSAWLTWDQHATPEALPYSLVWWGTVDDIEAEGREWKLRCRGPSSWLKKELNAKRTTDWSPIHSTLALKSTPGEREDLMGAFGFYQNHLGDVSSGAFSYYDLIDDVLPTSGNAAAFVSAIESRVIALLSTAGSDITWIDDAQVSMADGQIRVRIDPFEYAGFVQIILHELVWKFLGWDPSVQNQGEYDSPLWVAFTKAEGAPTPNYWRGTFHTLPLGTATPAEAGKECDNGGAWRNFEAIYPSGSNLLWPTAKQQVAVAGIDAPPYNEGQAARPPAAFSFNVDGFTDTCDRTGFFAFKGQYRTSIDDDPKDMVQIAKVSWKNGDATGGETFGGGSERRWVYIEKWLDSRYYGIDRAPLSKVWAAADGDLTWAPIAYLGYRSDNAADRADLVLLRMLLSTGTGYWEGYEDDDPTRVLGVNAHPDASYDEGNDVEIADLGLGIYHGVIDWASFPAAFADLPGGAAGPLARCKHAYLGPFDSQETIERILRPRGLAMGLRGGKYSLWSLPAEIAIDDVEVTLSPTDFDSKDVPFVEAVTLTPLSPLDAFAVTYGESVAGVAGGEDELRVAGRSTDPGAAARHSNAEAEVDGQGLVPCDLWPAGQGPAPWYLDFRKRWRQICDWRAKPHILVRGLPIRPSKSRDLHVGTIVALSSDWAPTRDGHYGLAGKLGRVVKVQRALQPGPTRVDILVQAGDPLAARRFAPHAYVIDMVDTLEERIDAATRKIWCYRDWMGHGEAALYDTRYFVEPAWSAFGGGRALVYGYQHDGRTWSKTFEFEAEAAGQAGDQSWVTWSAGTFSGAFKERMYTLLLLAPYDDQTAAWVQNIFLVNTRADHKFGAGPTNGWKLQ